MAEKKLQERLLAFLTTKKPTLHDESTRAESTPDDTVPPVKALKLYGPPRMRNVSSTCQALEPVQPEAIQRNIPHQNWCDYRIRQRNSNHGMRRERCTFLTCYDKIAPIAQLERRREQYTRTGAAVVRQCDRRWILQKRRIYLLHESNWIKLRILSNTLLSSLWII